MQITGQNTIVGTLTLELRDDFSRAYRSISITNGETLEISDKFRFDPSITDAVNQGFITVLLENEDAAAQEDITGGGSFATPLTMAQQVTPANPNAGFDKLYFKSDDNLYRLDSTGTETQVGSGGGGGGSLTVNDFVASADDFTILHNGMNLVRVSTSPTGSFFRADATTPIQAGTVIGQEVRISAVASTPDNGDAIFIYFNTDQTSTCFTNGNWLGDSIQLSYIDLVWDGVKWCEQERGVNCDDTYLDQSGQNSVAFIGSGSLGEQSFAISNSRATGSMSAALCNSVATGQSCFSCGGTAGLDPIVVSVTAPDTVTISGDVTGFFSINDEILLADITNGTGRSWINHNSVATVSFGGGNTTLTLNNFDNISGPIPSDSNNVSLYYITKNVFNAHSEGSGNARGNNAHAEGGSTASASNAHAEGGGTVASGQSSHSEGGGTFSKGDSSHSEGSSTFANNDNSHSEGTGTVASGNASHAEGNSTGAGSDNSHAEGSSCVAGWPFDSFTVSDHTVTISGSDARNRFFNGDQIFCFNLAGGPDGFNLLNSTVNVITSIPSFDGSETTFDVINDFGTRTSGNLFDMALAIAAHAEGASTISRGHASHAEGFGSQALAEAAHAEGTSTVAYAISSHTEGNGTVVFGTNGHAEGSSTIVYSGEGHAEGSSSVAVGGFAHAEGNGALAIGQSSHAEGTSEADSDYSHAEGFGCTVGWGSRDFTVSGSTISIAGDVTTEFTNGDGVSCWNLQGGTNNTLFVQFSSITSVPTFDNTNTTFDISPALDDRTSGKIVGSSTSSGAHAEGAGTRAVSQGAHAQGVSSFARQTGQHALSSGQFALKGDAQTTEVVARNSTTDATPTELYVTPGNSERLKVGDHTSVGYSIKGIARQTGGTSACAYFERSGFVTRDTGVATIRILSGGSSTTADATALTWALDASVDTGTGEMVLTATGEAAKNIQWVAHVRLVENHENA